jgi:prevent-host-death family protein
VTIGGTLGSIGVRKARERWQDLVKKAQTGGATVVLRGSSPAAVLIGYDESQHWRRVEHALAALHALGIYPEAAIDERELPELVRGLRHPPARRMRKAQTSQRAILGPLRTAGVSEVPRRFAATLDEVTNGQVTTVVSNGVFAATMIPPQEYERLRVLVLVESWFAALGLDLASSTSKEISAWVTRFRGAGTQSSV